MIIGGLVVGSTAGAQNIEKPITEADVRLFIRVLRTAAARIEHPAAADLENARIRNAMTKIGEEGRMPTAAEQKAIERVVDAGTIDEVVASEMGVDKDRYGAIKVHIMNFIMPSGGEVSKGSARQEQAWAAAAAHDQKVIGPHLKEIEALNATFVVTAPPGAKPDPTNFQHTRVQDSADGRTSEWPGQAHIVVPVARAFR